VLHAARFLKKCVSQGNHKPRIIAVTTNHTPKAHGDTLHKRMEIYRLLELEIKHKHGGFNINYEKATVVWQQFRFAS
jgi:hypothetical protein